MPAHYDFKKEWEKTKVQLNKLSKEAMRVAHKGEQEIVKFSKRSKLHVDATAANIKKEKLYYQIGKEYAQVKNKTHATTKLGKLIADLDKVNKEQAVLNRKLKAKKAKKK